MSLLDSILKVFTREDKPADKTVREKVVVDIPGKRSGKVLNSCYVKGKGDKDIVYDFKLSVKDGKIVYNGTCSGVFPVSDGGITVYIAADLKFKDVVATSQSENDSELVPTSWTLNQADSDLPLGYLLADFKPVSILISGLECCSIMQFYAAFKRGEESWNTLGLDISEQVYEKPVGGYLVASSELQELAARVAALENK